MSKLPYIITIIFLFVSCDNGRKVRVMNKLNLEIEKKTSIKDSIVTEPDSIQKMIKKSPIHGKINREELALYFPEVTDTIKDLRIFGSEKINLKTTNGIIVSILHNTGTFDQMILCTHDSSLNLIDNFYIGKATHFDKTGYTIEYVITDDNILKFDQVDWKYVKQNEDFEIDTVGYESYSISIDDKGKINKKNYTQQKLL